METQFNKAKENVLTHDNCVAAWARVSVDAVRCSDDPVFIDQRSAADVAAVDAERNLPGPRVRRRVFAVHHPRLERFDTASCGIRQTKNETNQ